MKFADFIIPNSLEEARTALKELGDAGFPVAGGTAFQYLSDRPGATAVDISRLDLGGITARNGTFHIGANTTLTDLVRYRGDGWVLDRIATLIPTHQIRNISTVAGNIARLFPWSDLPLGLLALDAVILVQGDKEMRYEAARFFAERPAQLLKPGDLITAIDIPALAPHAGFGFRKESVTNAAFSLMTACAGLALEQGRLRNVRVAVNAAVPVPVRLADVEKALEGHEPSEQALRDAAQEGIKNTPWKGREGMSDDFARHLAGVVVADALLQAWAEAKGEA